jgi:hypothetical protein
MIATRCVLRSASSSGLVRDQCRELVERHAAQIGLGLQARIARPRLFALLRMRLKGPLIVPLRAWTRSVSAASVTTAENWLPCPS